ncbi:MAG: class I SAM-dependent methyltransferase [Candidatus Micrarchaeota archaeon]
MDVYERLAGYYDLIYCDRLDLDFYMLEAKNARGPVLEAGCGTGRILLRLLSEGIEAVGMDISPPMIERLKQKAEGMGLNPEVHVADMADFDLGRTFSLIIVPYRSLLHLDGVQRKKALACFMEHLDKGGRLILHTYDPSDEERSMTEGYHLFESESLVSPEGKPYKLDWYLKYEKKGDQGHYRIAITTYGEREEFEMDIHYVEPKEMRQLLSSSGFRNIKAYCGFDYSPFDADCREVIWVAEK